MYWFDSPVITGHIRHMLLALNTCQTAVHPLHERLLALSLPAETWLKLIPRITALCDAQWMGRSKQGQDGNVKWSMYTAIGVAEWDFSTVEEKSNRHNCFQAWNVYSFH